MASNDNLRQAFKDFFGMNRNKELEDNGPDMVSDPYVPDASVGPVLSKDDSFSPMDTDYAAAETFGFGYTPDYGVAPDQKPEDIYSSGQPSSPEGGGEIAYTSRDTTYISKGTTIVGRIHTDGHLEVLGRIQGNSDAEGDVTVKGGVSGDITGDHLGLYSCKVKGNLKAESGVVISNESIVVGDVQTENVIIDGMLKGNISGNRMVMLKSNAYHLGDIAAHSISVENGAILNGNVKTLIDYDAESPFYDV